MRHPTEGSLRRLLDEPAAVADADRAHVEDCATCRAALDGMRDDAAVVGAALATVPLDDLDVNGAWHRLRTGAAPHRVAARPRRRLSRPVLAAIAAGAIVGGAGVAAANDWLPIFHTESIEPIGITAADLVALPDLDAYGELDVVEEPNRRSVADAAAAAAITGLDVPEVTALPRGVEGEPTYEVGDQVVATFTFSGERAADTTGDSLPPAPPGIEGSTVRFTAGPGLAAVWSTSRGTPGLLVARAVAPSASSDGVPFATVRDHLLSLPGFPDRIADQLRAFGGDGDTLPLPFPADRFDTSTIDVDGVGATLLEARSGLLAAVVWVEDGVVTVVAGPLDAAELLAVAEALR